MLCFLEKLWIRLQGDGQGGQIIASLSGHQNNAGDGEQKRLVAMV